MRFFLLGLVAASVLNATPIVRGTYSSSNSNVTCAGGSSHPQADCTVEYASNAIMPINNFAFILQASAGNLSSTGTDELSILDFSGANVTTPAGGDLGWVNGTTYSFSASYNATTRALAYTVGGTTINAIIANTMPITDIFFRTQAITTGASMKLNNLTVNGTSLGVAQSFAQQAVANQQIFYLWVSGLADSFSLSGSMSMTWATGSGAPAPPSGTNVVTYMKFGQAINAPVPEPASLAACGIGLILFGLIGRRRPKQKE